MRHDWILDVLTDLLAYAEENGLTDLARKIDETLTLARIQLSADDPPEKGEVPLHFRSGRRLH